MSHAEFFNILYTICFDEDSEDNRIKTLRNEHLL